MDILTSNFDNNKVSYPKSHGYWSDKDGNKIDAPNSCPEDKKPVLWNHYTKETQPNGTTPHKPGNRNVNPPKPLRKDDVDYKSTPYNKITWDATVDYYNKEGKIKNVNPPVKNGKWDGAIPFNEKGVPDLSFISRGSVCIGIKIYGSNILANPRHYDPEKKEWVGDDGRELNFNVANEAYGKQRKPKKTAKEVEKWMEENGYTWHEMDENGNMQKVPSAVHGAVYHSGGVSMFKQLYAEGKLEGIDFSNPSNSNVKKKTPRKMQQKQKS